MFLHQIKCEPNDGADEQDFKWSLPSMPVLLNHFADSECDPLESEIVTSIHNIKFEDLDVDSTTEQLQKSTHGVHGEDDGVASYLREESKETKSGCMSIEEFVNLVQMYGKMSRRMKNLKQYRSLRLVRCPVCVRSYKNSPDRLLRLFDHVDKQHQRNKICLLKQIIRDYDRLIMFMQTQLNSVSSETTLLSL